jgi:hypothetical protein
VILGDHFPSDVKLKTIKEKLQPGRVVYLFCEFTVPKPKDKYLLLGCIDPLPLFFVINSEVSDFIKERAHLLRCQARLDVASHDFLDHDSFIACHEAKSEFSVDDINKQLLSDMDRIKGMISNDVRDQVLAAVKACTVLPNREKVWILKALTPV